MPVDHELRGHVASMQGAFDTFRNDMEANRVALDDDSDTHVDSVGDLFRFSAWVTFSAAESVTQLDDRMKLAQQAALRTYLLLGNSIGGTPESFELFDAIDNHPEFIAAVETGLKQQVTGTGMDFEKVSDFARYIFYDKEFNRGLIAAVDADIPRLQQAWQRVALAVVQPYFDKMKNI